MSADDFDYELLEQLVTKVKRSEISLPRAAFVDIDGTLEGLAFHIISKPNLRAVSALNRLGILPVLASGRNHHHMLQTLEKLRLRTPIISSDGCRYQSAKTRKEKLLDPQIAQSIRGLAYEMFVTTLSHNRDGISATLTAFDHPYIGKQKKALAEKFQLVQPDDEVNNTYKVSCYAESSMLTKLIPRVKARSGHSINICRHGPNIVEFMPFGVSKVDGALAFAEENGLELNQLIAFGDGPNDGNLLKKVGLGVAMSHGVPEAQSAAKMVAPRTPPETNLAFAILGVLSAYAACCRLT